MKMEQTECSETSAYKIQTPGNYPKKSTQHTEHGESLKLGKIMRTARLEMTAKSLPELRILDLILFVLLTSHMDTISGIQFVPYVTE